MKIYLFDTQRNGHHKIYMSNLLKINKTEELYVDYNNYKIVTKLGILNFVFNELRNLIFLKKQTKNKYDCIFHVLTLDFFYRVLWLKFLTKKIKVLGTLHKIPTDSKNIYFLKKTAKNIEKIIVHSEFLQLKLKSLGILNVEVINYPSFYKYKNLKNDKKKDFITISALGETRIDKGLDILLKSFQFLPKNIQEKICLNISGREVDFTEEYISKKLKNLSITTKINLKYITDEEFINSVKETDIMIMPYKKVFCGNSGPMTEAIVNKIPCITPKGLNIGDLTEKYNLGLTFECENPKDLASKIEDLILNKDKKEFFTTDFYEKLTVENFLKSHEEIYRKLERGEY